MTCGDLEMVAVSDDVDERCAAPMNEASELARAHGAKSRVGPSSFVPRHSPCAFSADAAAAVDESASALARDLLDQDETIILLMRPSLWFIPLASFGSLMLIALMTF